MKTATWNGQIIAQSDDIIVIEGNDYFPLSSLNMNYFVPNEQTSYCPWKGHASYYDIIVDDNINSAGAWYYTDPMEKALLIKDRVAFWNGVSVT